MSLKKEAYGSFTQAIQCFLLYWNKYSYWLLLPLLSRFPKLQQKCKLNWFPTSNFGF